MRTGIPHLAAPGLGVLSFVMSCVLGYFACLGVAHLGLPHELALPAAVFFATLEVYKLIALNFAMNSRLPVLYRLGLVLSYLCAMAVTAMALSAYQRHATGKVDVQDAALVRAHDAAVAERTRLKSEIDDIDATLGAPGRAVAEIEVDAKRWANANLTCGTKVRDGNCAQQEAVLAELEAARNYANSMQQSVRLHEKLKLVVVPELPDEVVARTTRAAKPRSELSGPDVAATLLRDWVLALLEVLLVGFVALKKLAIRLSAAREVADTPHGGVLKVVEGDVSTVSPRTTRAIAAKNVSHARRSTGSTVETWLVARLQGGGQLAGTQREWALQVGCSDSTMSLSIRRLVADGVCHWGSAATGTRVLVAGASEPGATTTPGS